MPDALGCGRGECAHDRAGGQRIDEIRDAQIHRAKILPPLGDAVRLVHGKQRNRHGLRHRLKRGRFEALWGDVDDFVRALPRALHGEIHLARGERTVEVRGWNARTLECRHLIRHQRNQRRNNNRDPRQHQRRHLIAHGFSCARWHDAQCIPVVRQRIHHDLLPRSERLMPKVLPQGFLCLHPFFSFLMGGRGEAPEALPLDSGRALPCTREGSSTLSTPFSRLSW